MPSVKAMTYYERLITFPNNSNTIRSCRTHTHDHSISKFMSQKAEKLIHWHISYLAFQ